MFTQEEIFSLSLWELVYKENQNEAVEKGIDILIFHLRCNDYELSEEEIEMLGDAFTVGDD